MKQRVHPVLAGIIIAGALGCVVYLYQVVFKDYGNTGYHFTAADYKRAADYIKSSEKSAEPIPNPALRKPGEPQPFTTMSKTTRTPAWLKWNAQQNKDKAAMETPPPAMPGGPG